MSGGRHRPPLPRRPVPARVRRARGGAPRARGPARRGARPHRLLRRERRPALGHGHARRRARARGASTTATGPARPRRAARRRDAVHGRRRRRPPPRPPASSTTASTCSRARSWRRPAPPPSASTSARDLCSIDLDRAVSDAEVRAAEARANEVVWPRRVRSRCRTWTARRGATLGRPRARTRRATRVRLVEAEGFDRQACSGTHPRQHVRGRRGARPRTRALQGRHARPLRLRRPRAGGRARPRGRARRPGPGALRRAGPTCPKPSRASWTSARRSRSGRRSCASAPSPARRRSSLASHPEVPAVVSAVYDGRRRGRAARPGRADRGRPSRVALLATRGAKVQLVFARSKDLPVDVSASLKATLAPAGGRGGGRPDLAQGGCERAGRARGDAAAPGVARSARRSCRSHDRARRGAVPGDGGRRRLRLAGLDPRPRGPGAGARRLVPTRLPGLGRSWHRSRRGPPRTPGRGCRSAARCCWRRPGSRWPCTSRPGSRASRSPPSRPPSCS